MTTAFHIGRIGEALEAVVHQVHSASNVIENSKQVAGRIFDIHTGQPIEGRPAFLLARAVRDIYVPGTNEPGSSNVTRYPGFFAVERGVINAITRLNERKAALRSVAAQAKEAGLSWKDLRRSYAAAGYANCHALQVTREFNILPGNTRALGFTVAGSIKSMQNMTLEQCLDWLRKAGASDIISLLYERGYSENARMRVSRPVANHVRVNVFPAAGRVQQTSSSVPVLIDCPDWYGRVKFHTPAYREQRRSDAIVFQDSIPLPFINQGVLEITEQAEQLEPLTA